MTDTPDSFYTLNSQAASLVIDCRRGTPEILYWGVRLSSLSSPDMLALLLTRQEAQANLTNEPPLALSPEFASGFIGDAGIQAHRGGADWAPYLRLHKVQHDQDSLILHSRCSTTRISVIHRLRLDTQSSILQASTEITNEGESSLWVERCNAPCIPIPAHYNKILSFEGRWANEFQLREIHRFMGSYVRENRAGRTSHSSFPGVVVHTEQTNEQFGGAYGLHLGWSGNHRICIEEDSGGRAYVQMGELFYPGELSLDPGESYCSPALYAGRSHQGFSGLSSNFHRYVRSHLVHARSSGKEKPVHFNTWEAMYFDLSMDKLCELTTAAASVGAERFVLDDGWFGERKSDKAGLGDWFVNKDIFPTGLKPLIDHVQSQGMEFGLWLEPEMVNPDSDLYRAHPDWVLSVKSAPKAMFRNQLVLDLSRKEVQDYLFKCIDALLSEYDIAYLKWDMNRDLNQPGGKDGKAVTHQQTLAVYQLLARIRAAHTGVEIESCASGGGRADYGILAYTDRIWTSDSNDAIDRLRIQKGFSFFFPAEFMGSHVGPYHCHITGRTLNMSLRAGVAMFGHMGIEANILEMSEEDKTELAAAIELHKKHRKLIMSGNYLRLDLHDHESGFGIIAADGSEALFSYALIDRLPHSVPGRLRFRGLEANDHYQINVIWPLQPESYSKSILDVINGARITGEALMMIGMQLPIIKPENLLVIHLKRIS